MFPPPPLPVEVWRHIFSLLIRVPDAFRSDRLDPFSQSRRADAYWTVAPSTRIAFLLVSKDWYSMVSELIHEHIHLTCSKQVVIFADRLEHSKTNDGVRALGSLTRRVDVQLHNLHPDDARHLARLLRCTPNLEIFINRNFYMSLTPSAQTILPATQTPSEVIQALLMTCARSLHRVEWTCNESPGWSDLMDLLRELPGLRSLTLTNIYGSLPKKTRQDHLILPNLRTFIFGDSPSFSHASLGNVPLNTLLLMLSKSPDQLPCLQRLEGFSPFSPDFLRIHGHRIRTVRTVAYTPLLPEIIAECPNLETFVTIFPHQQLENFYHPTLRRIGIFPISEDIVGVPVQIFTAYIMKPLEDLMCQIEESNLPKLRQIRIRNTGTLAGVVEHAVFIQKWRQRWSSRGVRFDDKDGNPFQSDIRGEGGNNLVVHGPESKRA
ncbi:hypothetical protein L210DRAFT_3542937 [Boletus edulis BED1]|uniref:Uncharacterized protein n=1 Tax=Boletus edulis BED1 TaxID=1328754 RepID=A0AAD4BTK5_BOLED|nr:hypothetical protein L210DRAFT_3542937 [Boletus edulis BED1]